ncbi:MAG: dephospho-CoA kinase [Prevotellaceae bacterium]|jgi:dephospho-CoA kinase|nr:dephospho-CoA kinase [Prevotellaceae bacterium]
MAYFVGLTGGIGSGKTLVGEVFSTMGVPVFNADEETKKLYDTDAALRTQLINLLGTEIYDGSKLRRKLMAERIFAEETLLEKVNGLVHPVVAGCFRTYAAQQNAPYVLMESAILMESGIASMMRKTIAVTAPETLRLQRVQQRDGLPEETVRLRIRQQWTDERRNAAADFILVNDGKQAILPQVITIHEKLMCRCVDVLI